MGERADEMSMNNRVNEEGINFADTSPILATAETTEGQGEETERLRAGIEETRAEMGETISAIQEKLSPEHIMGQVKESVREATIGRAETVMENIGEKISQATEPAVEAAGRAGTAIRQTGSSVVDTIRQNPLPFALIGVGVGMLVVNKYRRGSGGYSAGRGDYRTGWEAPQPQSPTVIVKAQGTVGEAVSTVQETVSNVTSQAREQISQLGDQARERALEASYQLRTTLQERPLVVGAVAMAVGAAVGLAMPATRVEQEYLGEARDKLVDKAQQVAQDTMQKVQTVTQEAVQGAQQETPSRGQTA